MVTSSTTQPLSPRETHLLAAFIALDFNVFRLAETERLLPHELLAFTESLAIQSHLAALKSFADSAFTLRNLTARNQALDHLKHIASATDNLIEKRRAAAGIIRILTARTSPPASPKGEMPLQPPQANANEEGAAGWAIRSPAIGLHNHLAHSALPITSPLRGPKPSQISALLSTVGRARDDPK